MKRTIRLTENALHRIVRRVLNETINGTGQYGTNVAALYKANPQLAQSLDDVIEFCDKAATLSRNWGNDDAATMMFINTLEGLRNIRQQFNVDR
jgi:hypothetical protein